MTNNLINTCTNTFGKSLIPKGAWPSTILKYKIMAKLIDFIRGNAHANMRFNKV